MQIQLYEYTYMCVCVREGGRESVCAYVHVHVCVLMCVCVYVCVYVCVCGEEGREREGFAVLAGALRKSCVGHIPGEANPAECILVYLYIIYI